RHTRFSRDWSSDVCSSDLRPVVQRRRQPEPVLHQRLLARTVTAVHAADLRDGYVGLVDENDDVFRQVVEQGRGRLTGLAAGEVRSEERRVGKEGRGGGGRA